MRKVIAKLAVFVLTLAVSVPAIAADIVIGSADRQTLEIDLPMSVDLNTGDDVTIRVVNTDNGSAVDLSSNQITALSIDGNSELAQVTNLGDSDGYISISSIVSDPGTGGDIIFAFTTALTTNQAYTIVYSDSRDNVGAAMINFGTAGQSVVSATVATHSNTTIGNFIPSDTPIALSRNDALEIKFDITDPDNDTIYYALIPPLTLGGAVTPGTPAGHVTNTQSGATVTFIYFSSITMGTDNIAVALDDGVNPPVIHNIPVKITR